MTTIMKTLDELFSEDEEKRLAQHRAEQEAEMKAWWALPQSERERICAEREAKWDAIYEASKNQTEEDTDDEDEEYDEE